MASLTIMATTLTAPAGVLGVALALTAVFMLVEFVGGLLAGSLALMADAGHMLTDAAALALAWTATQIAARPADTRRSFGYQRLRVHRRVRQRLRAAVLVAWIAVEAVQRLLAPTPVDARARAMDRRARLRGQSGRVRDAAVAAAVTT